MQKVHGFITSLTRDCELAEIISSTVRRLREFTDETGMKLKAICYRKITAPESALLRQTLLLLLSPAALTDSCFYPVSLQRCIVQLLIASLNGL
jgi:hypothetical protein